MRSLSLNNARRRLITSALALAAACMATGCHPKTARFSLTEPQIIGPVQAQREVTVQIDPLDWPGPAQREFVEVDDDGLGKHVLLGVARGDLPRRVRLNWADQRVSVLEVRDDRVVIIGTFDHANDAWTTYDPPPTWIMQQRTDQPQREEFSVTVFSIRNADQVVDRGTGSQTYADQGDQWLTLLADPDSARTRIRCRRVRRTMSLDLKRADVESETIDWLAAPHGLVAQDATERVKVLGPLGWASRRLIVLERMTPN